MNIMSEVLLLTCVAVLCLKSAFGMWPGQSSGTVHNPAPGKVRVTFRDNDYAEEAISPVPTGPEWLKPEEGSSSRSYFRYRGYPRLIFQFYEIFTMTRVETTGPYRTNKYFSQAIGPPFSDDRIPVKGELNVNVGQGIQTFKTYFFKFYNAHDFVRPQSTSLPKQGQYGEVTGYIYIAMKGTKVVYMGELYLQKSDPNNASARSQLTRSVIWSEDDKQPGTVQVSFKDHIDVTASLTPTEGRPKWIESNYRRPMLNGYSRYSMYTMIYVDRTTTATYSSETTDRKGDRVTNVENHIPIKTRLYFNVGLRTETFKTDHFEPYNPNTLRALPFHASYGEVIGYIIIRIKGSKSIYVGHLCVHKSIPNNIPNGSAFSAVHMMPAGPGEYIYEREPPLRTVRVDFLDNASFQALLKPVRGTVPDWMGAGIRRNPHSPFTKYFMYTIIQVRGGFAAYLSESGGPADLRFTDARENYVTDPKKHLPVKAKLAVNVGQRTEIFKSYVLEPYDAFVDLLPRELPVRTRYGEVFGYIFITIKGTQSIYVGHLHVYRTM